MAAAASAFSATPAKVVETNAPTSENVAQQKNAVLKLREEKKSVTRVNDMGGVDFDPVRIAWTNPIYSPRKHTKETYRSQQRKAKKRR